MGKYVIERINISGFRKLLSIELPMKSFMVLIGGNGVGKTSFLDALSLLSASASGKLNSTLSQWGGAAGLITRDKSQEISLSVDMSVPGRDPLIYELNYELNVVPVNTGYSISKEVLTQDSCFPEPFKHIDSAYSSIRYFDIETKKTSPINLEHNNSETPLAQVPKMFRELEELRRILATANQYHILDVSPRAPVKLPQAMKPADLPGIDGEDLTPYLYYLRESDQEK